MRTTAVKAKPSKPAAAPKPASPLAALIALAGLKKGKQFAGLLFENDAWHLVVLLPGDSKPIAWKAAQAWAKERGGELPTRREQSLLFANLKDQFESAWYWSGELCAGGSGYAWCQSFYYGNQSILHKSSYARARAVRRLVIR